MPTPWEDPIKKTKQLKVFAGPGATNGSWQTVFQDALKEFNKLSSAQGLGVTLVQTTTAPDPNGPGGADVQFQAASGQVAFTAFGTAFSATIDGNALLGETKVIKTVVNQVERVAKAFIFVPSTPRSGGGKSRIVGDPVKLFIAVHELIHACGLTNSDHTKLSDPDVFVGIPSLQSAVKPEDDRVDVGSQRILPPLMLSKATASVITGNWT
jgi:hypothetical protein